MSITYSAIAGMNNNNSNNNNSSNSNSSNYVNSSSQGQSNGGYANHNNSNGERHWNGGSNPVNRFEYNYWVRIPLDPLRAACLRYAKTFAKVEQSMGNRVFFKFDSEGVKLQGQDKSVLSIGKKQFQQLSRCNQIELLTNGIDQEEYKQLIQREIRNQTKYAKCFLQLITYDAFKAIAIQLNHFGYDQPLKLYDKLMKQYPKFAILLCNEEYFAQVKQELLKTLKKSDPVKGEKGGIMRSNNTEKGNNFVIQYVKKEEPKDSQENKCNKIESTQKEQEEEDKYEDDDVDDDDDDDDDDEEKLDNLNKIDNQIEEKKKIIENNSNHNLEKEFENELEQDEEEKSVDCQGEGGEEIDLQEYEEYLFFKKQEYEIMTSDQKRDNFMALLIDQQKLLLSPATDINFTQQQQKMLDAYSFKLFSQEIPLPHEDFSNPPTPILTPSSSLYNSNPLLQMQQQQPPATLPSSPISQPDSILDNRIRWYTTFGQFLPSETKAIILKNEVENDSGDKKIVVEYKQQLFCLKKYSQLSDNKLYWQLANLEQHYMGDNKQLLQIYAIAVSHETLLQPQTQSQQVNQLQLPNYPLHLHYSSNPAPKNESSKEAPLLQQALPSFVESQNLSSNTSNVWNLHVLSELYDMNLKHIVESKLLLTPSQAIQISIQISQALKNLHDKKIVHGNLKLQNVLINSDWSLVLSDISLEPKNIELSSLKLDKQLTSNMQIAPELIKGESKVYSRPDFPSDIWSLGFLFADIISSIPLFTKLEQAKKRAKKNVQSNPNWKHYTALKALVTKCQQKAPFSRPTISQVIIDLKEILTFFEVEK